ncbi:NAD-dependent epimerase/dehydratase family protein [Desulfovibrio ferrophilus]|uniref:NAD-dependent epimerase/dehydratase n=1 Tax=Desulfovibrio ferrophilus TaxID=241368 RepID=A0A2Z6B0I7_9BACT|nr:NAD(P)-dependent oxidoreductase [Desulfovibrio ferrophilus]BBD09029.1 NAD-dependent epimerase/dehydratase [Desulfovibrio ferrophilus]
MSELAVVFGGSGFLGSHVCDELVRAGFKVRVCDRVESPHLSDGQEMFLCDILDPESMRKAVSGADYVYNFAGLADIDEARDKPIETIQLNVLGNAHILDACREANVKRYVFASTVYVYSEKGSFYRASKQASERIIEAYKERYGIEYSILRYGSLYGRRADMRNGIYRILHSALSQGKVTYSGTGDEQREYIHVRDAAKLSVRILNEEYANQHVILTGPYPYRVRDLMEMVREILGNKPDIEFLNQPLGGHYKITPYGFLPRVGTKLVGESYTDMGQGLLDCLAEMHETEDGQS